MLKVRPTDNLAGYYLERYVFEVEHDLLTNRRTSRTLYEQYSSSIHEVNQRRQDDLDIRDRQLFEREQQLIQREQEARQLGLRREKEARNQRARREQEEHTYKHKVRVNLSTPSVSEERQVRFTEAPPKQPTASQTRVPLERDHSTHQYGRSRRAGVTHDARTSSSGSSGTSYTSVTSPFLPQQFDLCTTT